MKMRYPLLLASLAMALTSCGGGSSEATDTSSTAEPTSTVEADEGPSTPSDEPAAQPFGGGSKEEIESALVAAGLEICKPGESSESAFGGSFEQTTYMVAPSGGCDPDPDFPADTLLLVDEYISATVLDEHEAEFGAPDAYVGDGLIEFRWEQYTSNLTETTPPDVLAPFKAAMESLDATLVYDKS